MAPNDNNRKNKELLEPLIAPIHQQDRHQHISVSVPVRDVGFDVTAAGLSDAIGVVGEDTDDPETKRPNSARPEISENENDPMAPSFKKCSTWANLIIFSLAELIGGFTFSLLSPFYTQEATAKGLSVTQTGLVYSSVFITTIVFSPVFGKFINKIGSRSMFLYGTFIAGATNILFGFLQWVDEPMTFLALSLATRFISAIGESAFFCSVYPLATKAAPKKYQSTVLSVMETMFGLGMMIGPFIGGVLYEVDGFYFPFVVCGGALVVVAIAAIPILNMEDKSGSETATTTSIVEESTPFLKLLKMPCVTICCLVLILAEASVTWYLPSLQPFLEENFHLTPMATGAMFMVEGATYAAFSPLWGYLLDKHVSANFALVFGCVSVIVGYCLIGPAPFLPFIPQNIYLIATGLFIQGSGVAAIFITTLVFMLDESVKNGAADSEQTKGMITSLWFIGENLGGYIGSSAGGYAYDKMGFENGTLIVIVLQMLSLVLIAILWKFEKARRLQEANNNNNRKIKKKWLRKKDGELESLLSNDNRNTTNYSSTVLTV